MGIPLKQILDDYPCLGHYAVMHCINHGYLNHVRDHFGISRIKRCPFEPDCKKMTLKYAENSDVYNSGQIDRPREWIRELKK